MQQRLATLIYCFVAPNSRKIFRKSPSLFRVALPSDGEMDMVMKRLPFSVVTTSLRCLPPLSKRWSMTPDHRSSSFVRSRFALWSIFCSEWRDLKSNLIVGPVVNIPAEIILQELAQGHLRSAVMIIDKHTVRSHTKTKSAKPRHTLTANQSSMSVIAPSPVSPAHALPVRRGVRRRLSKMHRIYRPAPQPAGQAWAWG